MTEKEVIREAMKLRGWSQAKLAEEAGFPSQSNITGLLNNNKSGIRIDNLYRVFSALGCDIVIRDKTNPDKEWTIEFTEKEIEESKPRRKRTIDLDSLLSEE